MAKQRYIKFQLTPTEAAAILWSRYETSQKELQEFPKGGRMANSDEATRQQYAALETKSNQARDNFAAHVATYPDCYTK